MVALKEVGNFALAELGITKLASGSGPAEHELTTLLCAVLRALVHIQQLLNTIHEIVIWYKLAILDYLRCSSVDSLHL